jgi:excisionase family DNA binding protein
MVFHKVSEVAKMLNVSVQTLRSMIKGGKIKVVQLNKKTIRIPQSELDRIMEAK